MNNRVRSLENLGVLHFHVWIGQAQFDGLLPQTCSLLGQGTGFSLMATDEAHSSLWGVEEFHRFVGPCIHLGKDGLILGFKCRREGTDLFRCDSWIRTDGRIIFAFVDGWAWDRLANR
jgi:hypothetical protein